MAPQISTMVDVLIEDADEEETMKKEPQALVLVWKSLAQLLIAPLVCVLLSIFVTSRYITLAVVFLVPALKPFWIYWRSRCPSLLHSEIQTTLALHKSLAFQFVVIIFFACIYFKSGDKCRGDVHKAYRNAKTIVNIETFLHMDFEPASQKFTLQLPPSVILFFNEYYARMHFVVPIGTLGWLLATGSDGTYRHRASFAAALLLALIMYWFIPTMPPRFLGLYVQEYAPTTLPDEKWLSLIDTVKKAEHAYDAFHQQHGNPYAAMPSMHTGWALWSALTGWDHPESLGRVWRFFLASHVLIIMTATIVTANHYWLDLAAGACCILIGRCAAKGILKIGEGFSFSRASPFFVRRTKINDDDKKLLLPQHQN